MKFSIVIPTYNHCEDLLKPCLESLFKYSNISDIELIIVSNGSKDTTFEYLGALKEKFNYLGLSDNLKVIWNPEPMGYSRATNAGIEVATTDLIVLLNNDVVLLHQARQDWLNILATPFSTNPKCGITCVIKGPSEPAGRDFAVFFCVMVHRKVFDKIGLLNTDYGVGGGEDTEFCIEAEDAGFEVVEALPKVWSQEGMIFAGAFPIYHKGEGTVHDITLVPNYTKIFLENSLKLAKKYNLEWYRWRLSNNYERAVFLKGDTIFPREATRYTWAAENITGKKIFELGCTTGYGIQFLPRDIEYTGVDYDEIIIKVAQEQGWDCNARFINADINQFPLDQYDTIVAFEVIEHLDNGLEIVEKLKKHCDTLLITVPMMEPPGFWGPHHKLHMLDESYFPGFEFKYISESGVMMDQPECKDYPAKINLMICKWTNPMRLVKTFDWLKEQDANMHREVIEVNQYSLTKEELAGRSVIDVGANIGMFSLLAASLGAKKVIGIEPVSKTFNLFQSNVTRSGLTSIIALKNLVSAEHGKYFQISNDNDNAGANSMYNVAENSEMVLSLSLSTILKMVEDDNILLKLDCEGAEYDILLNATQEEMSRINEIVLEIHTDLHPTFKGKEILENKLKEFGFTMTKSDQVYWYNVDHLGNKFDWKELPNCNQRWER